MRVIALIMLVLLPAPLAAGPFAAEATPASPVIALPEGAPPRPVASVVIEPGADPTRSITGTIAAASETDLAFTLSGRLAERRVDAGALVDAGQVLAVLDPEDADATLRGAEANVAAAAAGLAQATDAEARARTLSDKGVASQVQLDNATRARIGAEAALEQAEAARAAAADRLASTTLTAPEAGIVTATLAEPGASVTAGQPVLHLASIDRREVVIDVTEAALFGLTAESRFRVTLAADDGVVAEATAARVDPVAARATRTRRVHLALQAPPEGMRLGALVDVLPLTGAAALPRLPASALMRGEPPGVWVVSRDPPGAATGTVSRRIVTPAFVIDGQVGIAEGLAPGDEVVVRGVNSLAEGALVGAQVRP